MCTAVIDVPESSDEPVRMLALRDEDPSRPWDAPGPWWPERYPGVTGIRDVRAGGAWLAADAARRQVAVVLNRVELWHRPDAEVVSRGELPLESVAGRSPAGLPRTRGFNLIELAPGRARVTHWDGDRLRASELAPGVHMVAHEGVDDIENSPRIARWFDGFRAASLGDGEQWWEPWLQIVADSAVVDPRHPDALIRDQSFGPFVSRTLLVAAVEVSPEALRLDYAPLAQPGRWDGPEPEPVPGV